MSEKQNSNADRYRETAEEIRLAAERTRSPEIRIELFDLAERPLGTAGQIGCLCLRRRPNLSRPDPPNRTGETFLAVGRDDSP
jgi:hypothetical protein